MTESYDHILITGASSGIGAALAIAFAAPHTTLSISGRNEARLFQIASMAREKGADVDFALIDVADAEAMENWIATRDASIPIDLAIANAGISASLSPGSSSQEAEDALIDINIRGVTNMVRPLIPRMQARKKGHIALVSSIAGFRGQPGAPLYSGTKSFVRTYGEALFGRLRQHNINVSVICPGFVRSRITDANNFKMPFFMEADKAAAIIQDGLERKRLMIVFPWQMRLISLILSWMPSRLLMTLLSRLPEK